MPKRFAATVVVWGVKFIQRFLSYTLPSLLSDGNIPALHAKGDFTFHLYVLPDEFEACFRTHPVWMMFEREHKVCVMSLTEVWLPLRSRAKGGTNYEKMIAAHNHFAFANDDGETALIFLGPDAIYSEDCHQFQIQKLSQGYRAVLLLGLRVNEHDALGEIDQDREGTNAVISLSASRMVAIFTRHMHDDYDSRVIGRPVIASTSSTYFWEDGLGNMVARSFHHHPAMVWPQVKFEYSGYETTIDDYYTQSVIHPHDICFVENALECFVLSPSSSGAEGDSGRIQGHPTPYQIGSAVLSRRMNIRVLGNILNHFIIPAQLGGTDSAKQIDELVKKSFLDAQSMLSAIHDAMMECFRLKRLPGLAEGFVDGNKETLLTFGWTLRNPQRALSLLVCQPGKFLRFLFSHPIRFFTN